MFLGQIRLTHAYEQGEKYSGFDAWSAHEICIQNDETMNNPLYP